MAKLSMNCKKLIVKEVSNRLNGAGLLIVTSYKGLTAQEMNELRRELRSAAAEYLVVKDAMAKRALAEGPNNRVAELIKGDVGIAVDRKEDPIYISKILMRFSKEHEVLRIRGGIMHGEIISEQDIVSLASLPSREVLLARLANVLNAPIQGLAGALNAVICKVAYALNAVKKKKEEINPQESKTEKKEEQNG